ncbi:ATP-dependent helicase HrpB [Treponema sp.]|uniref:ATP-dependent helicase HrpB n=1 Tax=Treponema sp. TaxID=166 RepID=UPI0025DBF35B|nr:ATP-dependent helicase HrpB [Treponema sp.]MCR5217678.1 ATP-dependent helicase HrpB [Treponema sp.]
MLEEYPEEIKNLPVYPFLDQICDNLKNNPYHSLVLTAETAAGKSTAVPLALLKNFSGKIYMLEPRRVAAFNIASRVSELLGEETGETCGYSVHLENKSSDKTRFVVMTDAVLTRKMQSDPLLEGVNVVVIDEFHERSIHVDLALALLKEVMALRDDLYVIIMSATIDSKRICEYLMGTDKDDKTVPLLSVPGRTFPVDIEYKKDLPVEKAVNIEAASLEAAGKYGSILVFLPGLREIRQAEKAINELNPELKVEILHSSVTLAEQKKILKTEARDYIRIILSSSIAETSVTVKDVVCVIDSGLCRVNMYDLSTGMNRLETRYVSEFNAKQRSGRAGRICAGKCVRLWGQNEVLAKSVPPEILHSDLSSLVLECYKWGVKSPSKLEWLDCPGESNWAKAEELLELLACIKDKKITVLGEACLSLGLGIRVTCLALSGVIHNQLELSTSYALDKVLSRYESERNLEKCGFLLKKGVQKYKEDTDLRKCYPQGFPQFSTSYAFLCGYPDRLAHKESDKTYMLSSGRIASLKEDNAAEYIIVLDADAGSDKAFIYEFENIDSESALHFMRERAVNRLVYDFNRDSYKLLVKESLCFGKIQLKEVKKNLTPGLYFEYINKQLIKEGLDFLPLSQKSLSLLKRVQFYCQNKGSDYENLEEKLNSLHLRGTDWLQPFMLNEVQIKENTLYDALFWYLEGDKINRNVPEELILENGRKRKLIYESQNGIIIPVLEVIIQQIFGCFKTPEVMKQPVLIKLLSPARRPLQVTKNLEGFWTNTWPEICSEMKGRYPKHNWDYRIVDNSVDKL